MLSTQVLHNFNLIKVKGTLKAVCCLEFGRSGVWHAFIITRGWIILICVEHYNSTKSNTGMNVAVVSVEQMMSFLHFGGIVLILQV